MIKFYYHYIRYLSSKYFEVLYRNDQHSLFSDQKLQPRNIYRHCQDYTHSLWQCQQKTLITQISVGCKNYIRLLLLYLEKNWDQKSEYPVKNCFIIFSKMSGFLLCAKILHTQNNNQKYLRSIRTTTEQQSEVSLLTIRHYNTQDILGIWKEYILCFSTCYHQEIINSQVRLYLKVVYDLCLLNTALVYITSDN